MMALRFRLRLRRLAATTAATLLAAATLLVAGAPETGQAQSAPVFSFGVAGDMGANANTTAVLNAVAAADLQAFVALGDLSYSQVTPESAWCDRVKSALGPTYPFELVAGNHEDDGPDGLVSEFAQCLPDRLGVQGDYPRQYYLDYPAGNPLVRFIMISPKLVFPPSTSAWSYGVGSARYTWTADTIDAARAAGIPWVVVGMHMYCLSVVEYSCASGEGIMNLLVSKKVDLYLQAHDHAYARTKQLALSASCTAIPTTSANADCIADASPTSAYTAGNGTVLATVGMGGRSLNTEHPELPQGILYQTSMGSTTNATFGFLKVDVTATQLAASFVRGSGGSYTDAFTITKPPPPSSPPPSPPPSSQSPSSPEPSESPSATTSPSPEPSPTISPSPVEETLTLTAVADAFTQADAVTTTHGSDTALYVDSSPVKVTYLKFDATALAGRQLLSAQLRVTTTSSSSAGSPDTQSVRVVADTSWTEATLCHANRPAVGTAVIGALAGTAGSTTYAVPLTADALSGLLGGQVSLALDSVGGAGDAFYINSKEAAANPPQLVLTVR